MTARIRMIMLILVFAFTTIFQAVPVPVSAQSGSYLDTLYEASDSGKAKESEAAAETSQQPEESAAVQPAAEPAPVHFQQCQLSASQLEALIRNIIQQILSKFGCGMGGRVIIIRIPQTGTPGTTGCPGTTPPTPTKPTTPTPPTTPTAPTTPPATTPPSGTSSSAGLKAEMKAKYGITAADGDGATWSQRQLEEANKVLATLPAGFRSNTRTIQRDAQFMSPGVLGYVRMGIPTVHLLNSSCYDKTFQGTLVHEMTHTFQANNPQLVNAWKNQFWSSGRPNPYSVSSYGNTQPVEDFAESVRSYWQNGANMKKSQPERYEFVRRYVMEGSEY